MTHNMNAITVSIVIPTFRRKIYLLRVLDCLKIQTYQPLEVVVVDASPPEDQLSDKELESYPNWLCYRLHDQPGNISSQRNHGLEYCNGDILMCLDDDVEFSLDLIANHLRALKETGADGVSGLVLLPKEVPSGIPKQNKSGLIFDPGGLNYQAVDSIAKTHVICTANFSTYLPCIMAVGGFDEQLSGTLDDVDIGIRLVRQGYKIIHHPAPQVLHLKIGSSGSRSPELGLEWMMTNLFYFQFQHFPKRSPYLLLTTTLWNYCRPSRYWLMPKIILNRCKSISNAYRKAIRKKISGPILMRNSRVFV